MKIEIREIPGFPYYYISNDGSVFSQWSKNGRGLSKSLHRMRPRLSDGGYLFVGLRVEGIQKFVLIHRVVLITFVGPCPDGMECCHNDNDRKNNRLDNLRWGTHKENVQDRKLHGTYPIGEKGSTAKVTEQEVMQMKELRTIGFTWREIGEKFNMTGNGARSAIVGKTWKHLIPSE